MAVICLAAGTFLAVGLIKNRAAPGPAPTGGGAENQLAFVGNDHNIWLVSPDGENLRQLTGDGKGYSFPTWSPDGRYVAFIGPDQNRNAALYVSSAATLSATILFDVSDSAPFYLYWTPGGNEITFLTQETSGLAMRLAVVDMPGADRVLEQGAPFYWVWSPQGDRLLMHVGGSRAFSDEAHLSILENSDGATRI
ncbi:MAG: TolB family protein, partial [Anaerolineae bacterium]